MLKKCGRCEQDKELSDFPKRRISKDGHEGTCRSCRTKNKLDWYSRNIEKYRKTNKKWANNNKEKIKQKNHKWAKENQSFIVEYRLKNAEILRKQAREWQKNNPARCVKNVNMRRARKIQRTPPWLSKEHHDSMLEMYELSRKITKDTGVKHDVDHIIPLNGKNVSGLHVPWNLQIIPAHENRKKSNKVIFD